MRCNGFFCQTEMQRVPGLQLSRSKVRGGQWQLQQHSLKNAKVEELWDSSFSSKLLFTALYCHKTNWLQQLRGFIPGIRLNWINQKINYLWPALSWILPKIPRIEFLALD